MSDPFKGGPSKCAICGKPPAKKFAPFCSQRCADLDLGRWLKGSYVIPAAPEDDQTRDGTQITDVNPDED